MVDGSKDPCAGSGSIPDVPLFPPNTNLSTRDSCEKNFSREIKSNDREVVVGNPGVFPEVAEKRAVRWFFQRE